MAHTFNTHAVNPAFARYSLRTGTGQTLSLPTLIYSFFFFLKLVFSCCEILVCFLGWVYTRRELRGRIFFATESSFPLGVMRVLWALNTRKLGSRVKK